MGLPAFLELWNVAYYPSQDCARGDADAEFSDQFGQVPVAEFKTQIPAHTRDDNVVGEPNVDERVDDEVSDGEPCPKPWRHGTRMATANSSQ